MKNLHILLIFLALTNSCFSATFAERVAFAKEVEQQKEAENYFFNRLFPTIGPDIGGIMKWCSSIEGADHDKFTFVADINLNGEFTNIDFEPKTNNTGACFAKEITKVIAPPPPMCDSNALPFVLEMSIEQ